MNHYPYHIGDFDKSTRHLNRIERSIYRDLLDVYYETESPLSLDLVKLKRKILANTEQESTAVEHVLNEFFVNTPNGWFHSRCDAEIVKFQDNTTQKALAGKASAAAKAQRRQQALNGRLTDVEQTYNGTSTNQNLEPEPRTRTKEKKAALPSVGFILPDWIDRQHWDAWHMHPKRQRLKPEQKQLAVDQLAKWRDAGIDHALALQNSATNNWQGLFEPKPDVAKAGYETPYARTMREKYESITPLIAAKNPNAPKKINPNDFINGAPIYDERKLTITG
jgi:uncharacterized protein YdaU (DUF1376 family)